MGCKMTKPIKKQRAKTNKRDDETSSISQDLSQVDVMSLNRKQLQTLCKELGLKANGKTTELQEKLKSYKPLDVNNNITSEDENEASEDKKLKERNPQVGDNPRQVSGTSKACPKKTISKTTKSKTLEKRKTTAVGDRDKDGQKERKNGRVKVKTEKKSRGSKNEKGVTKENSVTRTDDKHLVDDDSFVIENICKYDDVSKHGNNDDSKLHQRRIYTRQTSQKNVNRSQVGKENKKNPTQKSKTQMGDKTEDSSRANVQGSKRNPPRGIKDKKADNSRNNLGAIEKEKERGEIQNKEGKSKNDVKTNSEAQSVNESDNVLLDGDMLGDSTNSDDPASKKRETKANNTINTVRKDNKNMPVEECVNKNDNDSNQAGENYIVDVTGLSSHFGSFVDDLDGHYKHLEIVKGESGPKNYLSSPMNFSYHLKTIELNQSCSTEKEYESTFTVDETGQKQTNEKSAVCNVSSDSCLRRDSDAGLILGESEQKEENRCSPEQEKDSYSTFTVEVNDLHQSNCSLMDRGSSVSSTEDVDLRNSESRAIKESQSATCCTRWCVVEGIPKHDSEISWKRIKLKGGRPVVANRFGKHIPFVLEPSNIEVPCDFRDNYICGVCVRDNERLNGERGGTKVALATRKELQRPVSQGNESQKASDDENNETPLSAFTRGEGIRASVKRKRLEDHSTLTRKNQEEQEFWALHSKRQRSSLSRSNPGIPASPVARKARGEKLNLPRNHKKAWRPKKATRSSPPLKLAEDASFAQKVEAIIKTTVPGSEEELNMIMSRNCRVRRSPAKTEQD